MHSIFIGLVAASASAFFASSTGLSECNLDPNDLSIYGQCDQSLVVECVSALVGASSFSVLEQCLVTGGCPDEDAALTAEMAAEHCESPTTASEEDVVGDLRKKQKRKDSSTAASATNAKSTAAPAKTSAAKTTEATPSVTDSTSAESTDNSTTDSPSSAAASTTNSPSTTDSASTSTSPASATSSSASSTTTTPSTTSSPTSSTSKPLECLTTSQQSTTWCITTTNGASKGSTCIPTFTPIIGCAPGLICQTQAAGETSCMIRQNGLTTSGLVVTIVFATVLVAFFASLFGMCIKSRQTSRRHAREHEAALIAGTKAKNMRDVEASNTRGRMGSSGGAGASEDHLPLMAAQGPSGGGYGNSRDGSADRRPSAHRVPSGTYQDVVTSRTPSGAPRLHPGLMGGPEMDEDDMGYRGARGGR